MLLFLFFFLLYDFFFASCVFFFFFFIIIDKIAKLTFSLSTAIERSVHVHGTFFALPFLVAVYANFSLFAQNKKSSIGLFLKTLFDDKINYLINLYANDI